jgi:hypothetical protein
VEVEARAADGSLQGQRELPAVGGELALGPAFTF